MARKTKTEKFQEQTINALYKKHAEGKQINVFDMGKVWSAALAEFPNGLDAVEAAVVEAVAKYCK